MIYLKDNKSLIKPELLIQIMKRKLKLEPGNQYGIIKRVIGNVFEWFKLSEKWIYKVKMN